MDLQLKGKRALVTGASSGIGRGIAMVLAREGVEVVVHGRNRERCEATLAAISAEGGDKHIALVPLRRICEPDEVAEAAVWLCSPAASYVTGITLSADGGYVIGSG